MLTSRTSPNTRPDTTVQPLLDPRLLQQFSDVVEAVGARPLVRHSTLFTEIFGAKRVDIMDLCKNPSGAYKVNPAAPQYHAVKYGLEIEGAGWVLDAARREALKLHGAKALVGASTGNFAAGCALLSSFHQVETRVYMPNRSVVPAEKLELFHALGRGHAIAQHVESIVFDDARDAADRDVETTGAGAVQPYDSGLGMLGNAAGAAIAIQNGGEDAYDLVIFPNGGGGIAAGGMLGIEALCMDVGEYILVEPAVTASLTAARMQGGPAMVSGARSLASGANVRTHGSLTYRLIEEFRPTIWPASELDIARGMVLTGTADARRWEGAAAQVLSPLFHGRGEGLRVLVVLSGVNASSAEIALAEQLVAADAGAGAVINLNNNKGA